MDKITRGSCEYRNDCFDLVAVQQKVQEGMRSGCSILYITTTNHKVLQTRVTYWSRREEVQKLRPGPASRKPAH